MNKKTIITALLAIVAIAGQGQNAKFKIEGNIGQPDYTGAVHIIDLHTNDTVSSAQVDKGLMLPTEGGLERLGCVESWPTTGVFGNTRFS